MAYVFLLLAISCDVTASSLLKSTVGFTRLWPTAAVLTGYVLSFVFLSQAVKSIRTDCDADVLLFKVHQHGNGACHTGERTCFYRHFG